MTTPLFKLLPIKYILSIFMILACMFITVQSVQAIESVGTIEPPPGTEKFIERDMAENGSTEEDISILFFISRMIRLVMIVAGGWATVMILLSAYTFISSSGDSSSYQKVRNQLTNAVIGLMLIMITFTITGIISLLLFGDASFIFNPQITRL